MLKYIALLSSALLFSSCTSSTHLGECVGIGETQDPAFVYDLNAKNVVLGIVFVETVVVPVVVVFDELHCPVRRKTP